MKVVAGLGNPGRKYEGTRHNVGFEVLGELAKRFSAAAPKVQFEAEISEILIGSERVLLVAPQTFMNLSGRSLRQVLDFYKLPIDSLLVICDDLNLRLARIRLRKSGTSGGQKGLQNVIQQLGTEQVCRLRLGIDPAPIGFDSADYVLGKFGKRDRAVLDPAIWQAADAVEVWVKDGIESAMNRFNGAGEKGTEKGEEDKRQ